ncbi:hypothetical protein BC834DRAFT_657503 [Gloeopeniophorella convolvens]|nr:hypothetical protein BC834DRAFT_657503 [Gloeopeniophorella convolvens]
MVDKSLIDVHHQEAFASARDYWLLGAFDIRLQELSGSREAASPGARPTWDFQTQLGLELHALSYLTISVKRRWNDLSPVAKLPDELIALIISFHAENQPPSFLCSTAMTPLSLRLGWLVNTHVCHRWRHVAMTHASLWVRPPFLLGCSRDREFITRAASAGLVIRCDESLPSNSTSFISEILSEQSDRTVDLGLSHYVTAMQNFANTLTRPAPMLKSLTLECKGAVMVLPADLFAGYAPQLRNVRFKGVHLSWDSELLRNLCELSITRTAKELSGFTFIDRPPPGIRPPTQKQLLNVLRSSQNLHTLALGLGWLPSVVDALEDEDPPPFHPSAPFAFVGARPMSRGSCSIVHSPHLADSL